MVKLPFSGSASAGLKPQPQNQGAKLGFWRNPQIAVIFSEFLFDYCNCSTYPMRYGRATGKSSTNIGPTSPKILLRVNRFEVLGKSTRKTG